MPSFSTAPSSTWCTSLAMLSHPLISGLDIHLGSHRLAMETAWTHLTQTMLTEVKFVVVKDMQF